MGYNHIDRLCESSRSQRTARITRISKKLELQRTQQKQNTAETSDVWKTNSRGISTIMPLSLPTVSIRIISSSITCNMHLVYFICINNVTCKVHLVYFICILTQVFSIVTIINFISVLFWILNFANTKLNNDHRPK